MNRPTYYNKLRSPLGFVVVPYFTHDASCNDWTPLLTSMYYVDTGNIPFVKKSLKKTLPTTGKMPMSCIARLSVQKWELIT